MHFVHKISFMIHTASCDFFLENQGIKSYFENLLRNLSRQTIKEFEFIFVDTFYEENKEKFDRLMPGLPFIVKHVPVHKNHRYWYDKGHTYISAAKNTGILHADGELLITCDDAEFFPDDLLERYWNHYKSGHYMIAMHNRLKNIRTEDGFVVFPIAGEVYINDHRFLQMKQEVQRHSHGSWAFAGTSFSLQDALTLNGFNERMDGCKSLEDCDFGNRLTMLGRKFILDKKGVIFILDHQCYTNNNVPVNWEPNPDDQLNQVPSTKITRKNIESLIAVENYGMYMCGVELKEIVANKNALTPKHMEIIKRETLKYRKFDPFAASNSENLNIWMNVPTFDLQQERLELRSSSEWRWG